MHNTLTATYDRGIKTKLPIYGKLNWAR